MRFAVNGTRICAGARRLSKHPPVANGESVAGGRGQQTDGAKEFAAALTSDKSIGLLKGSDGLRDRGSLPRLHCMFCDIDLELLQYVAGRGVGAARIGGRNVGAYDLGLTHFHAKKTEFLVVVLF